MQSFGIAGSGVYVPRTRIRSDQLDERAGRAPGDTEKRMAICARGFAGEDEPSSLMAAEAANAALVSRRSDSFDPKLRTGVVLALAGRCAR